MIRFFREHHRTNCTECGGDGCVDCLEIKLKDVTGEVVCGIHTVEQFERLMRALNPELRVMVRVVVPTSAHAQELFERFALGKMYMARGEECTDFSADAWKVGRSEFEKLCEKPFPAKRPRLPEGERPLRVTLKRTKGWRMPDNTVKVDRGTKWGNPFAVGDLVTGIPGLCRGAMEERTLATAEEAVLCFKLWLGGEVTLYNQRPPKVWEIQQKLRGKHLACWCKPGAACHAEVLLDLANGEEVCDAA